MRYFLLALALLIPSASPAQEIRREAFYRDRFCAGMETEVYSAVGRADCRSATHAIEVEWSRKWKEGIGQALAYGVEEGLIPGLILVCREDQRNCLNHQYGTEQTLGALPLRSTLWLCSIGDQQLSDCAIREYGD